MKTKITVLILSFTLAMGSSSTASAQAHEQGQIGITAGVGYSLIGGLFSSFSDVSVSPVINGMVDYGIGDKFSLGLAFSYESFKWTETGLFTTSVYTVKATCMNIGVRPLFHFGNSDDLDWYFGGRVGITNWTVSDNDPTYESTFDVPGIVGVMPLIGASWYPIENLGLNMEFGFGTYLAAIGAKARF